MIETFLIQKKNCRNAKTYDVEILNSFNPELQFKGTKSAIKNKLIDLLTELKGLQFVTALEFKR